MQAMAEHILDWRKEIDRLSAQNRRQRDPFIEQQLTDLRIRAQASERPAAQGAMVPKHSLFPDCSDGAIPEIDVSELTLERLSSGVRHHGALIVRGLFTQARADQFRAAIDAALGSQDDEPKHSQDPWFNPPESLLNHKYCKGRDFVQQTGGMWAPDSPRILFELLEEYERLGLRPMLDEYFGEPAWLSVKKWVLRRVAPLAQASDWHQDGAFMGAEVSSMNLWVACTECGGDTDSPGMDIIPKRLEHIVTTGTDDASFEWSVGSQQVLRQFADTPAVKPHFAAGDAIFFDHFNLHRTSYSADYQRTRYAIECWFLGRSHYPERQVPLYW